MLGVINVIGFTDNRCVPVLQTMKVGSYFCGMRGD